MKREYINQLLNSYLEGTTTCQEEETLRSYFGTTTDSLPQEWMPFKALFAYVDHEREALSADDVSLPVTPAVSSEGDNRLRLWINRLAIAASVAILVGVFFSKSPVGSSYVVINGQVITDAATVHQEAEQALLMVADDSDDPFEALHSMQQ